MELLHAVDGDLLESPVWDHRDESVLFVDFGRPALHRLTWDQGVLSSFGRGTAASAALPARDCGLVVAERAVVTAGAGLPPVPLGDLVLEEANLRFNDAACDSAGRLWVGTMADDASPGAGALYRLDPDLTWHRVLDGVTISNGIGWSPDDRFMYYADSATRQVAVFDFDLEAGTVSDRRLFVDTSGYEGMPDGLTVDADGCVWVAFYRGAAVRRFAPDGRLLEELVTPVPRPTSVCFAGPELDTLVVTVRGETSDLDGHATGAHLYAATPGTRGLPTAMFGG